LARVMHKKTFQNSLSKFWLRLNGGIPDGWRIYRSSICFSIQLNLMWTSGRLIDTRLKYYIIL
jgi:hypothetical protein